LHQKVTRPKMEPAKTTAKEPTTKQPPQNRGPIVRFFVWIVYTLLWMAKWGAIVLGGVALAHYLIMVLWYSLILIINGALRFALHLQYLADNVDPAVKLWGKLTGAI
jgi:hypothetical protein